MEIFVNFYLNNINVLLYTLFLKIFFVKQSMYDI